MSTSKDMVRTIRRTYGLDASKVEKAMLDVPREEFVPKSYKRNVYDDAPIPIGYGQTMSQPYTVAFMTSLLNLEGGEKVMEIGTGSGYQAAVLAELVDEVYTIEIVRKLAKRAQNTLKVLGYKNVHVKTGSGEDGWPEKAPFDTILITAGIERQVPDALFGQLKKGGVLVAPIGRGHDKKMTRFTKKSSNDIKKEEFGIFHFVPFIKE